MSLSSRPIVLFLLIVQLVTYGSCIFLKNQDCGLGHEARLGSATQFNESLVGTSFLRDSATDPSILFARQATCTNGITTCIGGDTCQNCETCCGSGLCSGTAFGQCCNGGTYCDEGLECWIQVGGTRTGCCPPGTTSCFAATFACCNPGASCGSAGCFGSPSIFVTGVAVTYTSTVSRFTTNTIVVTSPSGAAATVSVTVLATSLSTALYTVTSTTSVAAVKARHGILEAFKGQLEKYELLPRAIPTSTFVQSYYSFVTILTTFTATSTFLSGSVAVHTVTYTSTVVNQVSVATTVLVTATIAGPVTTPAKSPGNTPANTPANTPENTPANTPASPPANNPTATSVYTSLVTTTAIGGGFTVIPVTISPSPTPTGNGTGGLSTGAKAGIGAGVGISAAASLVFLALFLLGRRRSKSDGGAGPGAGGEAVEVQKTDPKTDLPPPGPYMGPIPEKPHRETYQYVPVAAESVPPQHQDMSPTSPTPSSTTRFSELGGISSTQGRAEVSAQPMGYQAAIGSDYEHYELQANEAGRPRSELR